jgi:hypothetical protein
MKAPDNILSVREPLEDVRMRHSSPKLALIFLILVSSIQIHLPLLEYG